MKKFLKKAEGFTLVELIVVIAILGILTAVAVPAYTGYIEKSKEAGDTQVVAAVLTATQGAMAQEGTINEVRIDTAKGVVAAVMGSNVYVVKGDASVAANVANVVKTGEKLVIASGTEGANQFKDEDLTTIRGDFDTYYAGNSEPAFEHKAPVRGATDGSKDVANYAVWAGKNWSFENIPTT